MEYWFHLDAAKALADSDCDIENRACAVEFLRQWDPAAAPCRWAQIGKPPSKPHKQKQFLDEIRAQARLLRDRLRQPDDPVAEQFIDAVIASARGRRSDPR